MPRAKAQEPHRRTFEARYAGLCLAGCRIVPGDEVHWADEEGYDGVLIHTGCVGLQVSNLWADAGKACPICNLTACDHEASEKAAWKDMG